MFFGVAALPMISKRNSNYQMNCHVSLPFFPNIVNLPLKWYQTGSNVNFFTFEIFFYRVEGPQPEPQPSLNAACKSYFRTSDHHLVIFPNHQTLPHPPPSPQHVQLIRPSPPTLPVVRRHLYSCTLCLATSTGAILDRIHRVNTNLM